MLLYVHQLAANFVCMLFDAKQVVYSGFIRAVNESRGNKWVKLQAVMLKKGAPFTLHVVIWSIDHIKILIGAALNTLYFKY